MSKAFTRESDDGDADEIGPIRSPARPGEKRHLTRQGADRLRQQADVLFEEKRALLHGAAAGSTETTTRVRRIEAAIQRIQQVLDSVIVAEPPADRGRVGLGAFVRTRDQQGEEEEYQIVGPDEAEPGQGRISSISPLAQALMNRVAGERARFKSPAGEQELMVLNVHY